MKRLVLAIALASLAALPGARAAAPRAPQCPALSVSCPDMATPGQPVTFTANVSGGDPNAELTFNWTVSAGTINSGQGTSSVTVDTTGAPPAGGVTAKVEVGGLHDSCAKTAECSVAMPVCYLGKIDEYGNLRWGDERARLDNYAIELLNDPGVVGYVFGYGGRRARRGEAARRIERAKNYLTAARAIPAGRVVTIDGGYREELTVELWVSPKGVSPPQTVPTVDPGEVVFIDPAPKRRPRRRRKEVNE
jgi:hypothetical protein